MPFGSTAHILSPAFLYIITLAANGLQCYNYKLLRVCQIGINKALLCTFIMPRGIPNAKRDETGMRYTVFNVPPA